MTEMTLIYSPDEKGWYWERRDSDWKVSQLFPSKRAAKAAKRKNQLTWS